MGQGVEWQALLTPWGPEAEVMHECYRFPPDAYTVQVRDGVELCEPISLRHVQGADGLVRKLRLTPTA